MSRERLKALMAMLHVVDPSAEDGNDKMRKVRTFLDHFKERCKALHQPFQNVSVDERMVKSKPRSGICQYIKKVQLSWLVGLLALSLLVSHLSLSLVLGWLPDFQEHPHRFSPRG